MIQRTYIQHQNSQVDSFLKGFGQIIFQENSWSGLLLTIGLFVGNWQCGIGGIMSVFLAITTASVFGKNKEHIYNGLVSFNAALVGIALTYFFGITVYSLLFIFLGSILATLLFIFCLKRNIPAYTFPFIVITWFFYWLHSSYISPAINTLEILPSFSYNTYFTGINGFGQVVFQGNSIAGVFIFAAVFVNMPFQAVISLIVASVSAILSLYFHQPLFNVLIGLYGFNVILTTLALLHRNSNTYFWTFIGIVLTFTIHILLLKSNLLTAVGGTLTAPFVVSVWIVLLLKQLQKKITLSSRK